MKIILTEKERTEVYNALCCLNVQIRDRQKKRAKFVQGIIPKFESDMKERTIKEQVKERLKTPIFKRLLKSSLKFMGNKGREK